MTKYPESIYKAANLNGWILLDHTDENGKECLRVIDANGGEGYYYPKAPDIPPPPLGIHIQDGIGAKEKLGG